MAGKPNKPRRRRRHDTQRKENFMYFEDGLVVETLPGTMFKIKVKRFKGSGADAEELPPIFIMCSLKSVLIKRRVLIIKGDHVVVEVNPEDMSYNEAEGILKGTIIQRK